MFTLERTVRERPNGLELSRLASPGLVSRYRQHPGRQGHFRRDVSHTLY
jgi:hypothetical protein